MSTRHKLPLAEAVAPPTIPDELQDAIDDFFTEHPDPSAIDDLLWRMFFHSTLHDINQNGAAAYLEEYGNLKSSVKRLIDRLRSFRQEFDDD